MWSDVPVLSSVRGHDFHLPRRYSLQNSKLILRGRFSIVITARDLELDKKVTITKYPSVWNVEDELKLVLKLVKALKLLTHHPNIIGLVENIKYPPHDDLYVVKEFVDTDLYRVISTTSQEITIPHIQYLVKQLLGAVKAMHDIGIIHWDIKPDNILVSKDCQLRLTGFSYAAQVNSTRTWDGARSPTMSSNTWYFPPEILLQNIVVPDLSTDMFAVGLVIAELIIRKPLFPGTSIINQIYYITQFTGYTVGQDLGYSIENDAAIQFINVNCVCTEPPPLSATFPTATPELINLLEQLLKLNPRNRITAEQAIEHTFFEGTEVLHDYSRRYLAAPALGYFDFESPHSTCSLADLQNALLLEVTKSPTLEPLHLPLSIR